MRPDHRQKDQQVLQPLMRPQRGEQRSPGRPGPVGPGYGGPGPNPGSGPGSNPFGGNPPGNPSHGGNPFG